MNKITLSFLTLFGLTSAFAANAANTVGVITDFDSGSGYQFNLPMNCALLAGNNNSGLIIAGGYQNRTIKRIESYSSGHIANISDPGIPVKFLTGENRYGPIVVAQDGYTIKYMDSYASNVWKTLPRPPFSVKGIVGNNQTGIIIFNGGELAYLSSYNGSWVRKRLFEDDPNPFNSAIGAIAGNNTSGIWVIGSGGLYYLKKSSSGLDWVTFLYTNQDDYAWGNSLDVKFTGNPSDGLIMMKYDASRMNLYTHYGVEGDRFRAIYPYGFGRTDSGSMNIVGDPIKGVALCTDSGTY